MARSVAHLALGLPEILDEICHYLGDYSLRKLWHTCVAMREAADRGFLRQGPSLRRLISLLPDDLIVRTKFSDLYTYFGDFPREDLWPLEVSAVMPHPHHINLQFKNATFAGVEAATASPQGGSIVPAWATVLAGNTNPPFELTADALGLPADSHVERVVNLKQFQFVKIFRRPPRLDDLSKLLDVMAKCCTISYAWEDHQALVVLLALRRLFPDIEFLPQFRTLALIPPFHYYAVWGTVEMQFNGIAMPFALLRNTRRLVIRPPSRGPYRGWSTDYQTVMVNELHRGTFANLREIDFDLKWSRIIWSMPWKERLELMKRTEYHQDSKPYVAMRAMLRAFIEKCGPTLRRLRLPATPDLSDWKWLVRCKVRELHLGHERRATKEWMPHEKDDDDPIWHYYSYWDVNRASEATMSALNTLICTDGAVCPDLIGVFRTVRFANLTRMVIRNAYNRYNVMGVAELWTEDTHRFPNLEFLSIELFNTKHTRNETPPKPLITIQNLKQMMRVAPKLEHLHVSCPVGFCVEPPDQQTLGTLARTWSSKLQYLYLDPTRPGDATLSLADVVAFIGRCPNLETFGMGVNIDHFFLPTDEEIAAYPPCPNPLTLNLGAPRVHDPRAAADTLRRIFPNLKRYIPPIIRTNDDADETRGPAWRQITKLLRESSPRSSKADEP